MHIMGKTPVDLRRPYRRGVIYDFKLPSLASFYKPNKLT